ncbi:hypothetical protein ACB092_03G059600 [Castanea dentata]
MFSLHTHLCAFASLLDTSCNTSHRTCGLTKLYVLFNYGVLYLLVEYACGWIWVVVLWSVVVLLVSKFQTSRLLVFCEDLFFLYLLSPFIFNAGCLFSSYKNWHDKHGYSRLPRERLNLQPLLRTEELRAPCADKTLNLQLG